jgi:hypothetical protein
MDVTVKYSHAISGARQGCRKIDGDRGLSYAALPAHHHDSVSYRGQSGGQAPLCVIFLSLCVTA